MDLFIILSIIQETRDYLIKVLTFLAWISYIFLTASFIFLSARMSTMKTKVLLSSIFFMADSVVKGNFRIWYWSNLFLGGDAKILGISWSLQGPWSMEGNRCSNFRHTLLQTDSTCLYCLRSLSCLSLWISLLGIGSWNNQQAFKNSVLNKKRLKTPYEEHVKPMSTFDYSRLLWNSQSFHLSNIFVNNKKQSSFSQSSC